MPQEPRYQHHFPRLPLLSLIPVLLQDVSPVQQARLDVLAHPGHFDIITLLHQLTTQTKGGHVSVSLPV